MSHYLNGMIVHLLWLMNKVTYKGWEDIRKTKGNHTLYWIHEGKGTFYTEDAHPIRKGTLTYLPPGLEMRMKSSEEAPLTIMMVRFECTAYRFEEEGWSLQPIPRMNMPVFRQYEGEPALKLDRLFEALWRDWVPARDGGEVHSKNHLMAILELIHQAVPEGRTDDLALQSFYRVKAEMEEQFQDSMQIDELAAKHSVSSSYLRKMFVRHVGMSPKSYLDKIRNEHAIRYLAYSDIPLRTIAASCGYRDEFQFSKVFKKMNGCPPSLFRQQHAGHGE